MRAAFIEPGLRPSIAYHQIVIENALLAAPLFAGLPAMHIARIVGIGWVKSLESGERLFSEGEASRGLYVVQTGNVRLFRVNARGDEQVVHIANAGESFAEESLFAPEGYCLNASAVKSTRVVVLPKNEFLGVLKSCPELLMRMTCALSHHLCQMISLLDDLRLKSARVRLENWLLQRCSKAQSDQPQTVLLSIPKKVVASELGMASETFSRVLAQLQCERLIAIRGRSVVLLSPRRLRASMLEEMNEPAGSTESEGPVELLTNKMIRARSQIGRSLSFGRG